jgi:hypothetical protein
MKSSLNHGRRTMFGRLVASIQGEPGDRSGERRRRAHPACEPLEGRLFLNAAWGGTPVPQVNPQPLPPRRPPASPAALVFVHPGPSADATTFLHKGPSADAATFLHPRHSGDSVQPNHQPITEIIAILI